MKSYTDLEQSRKLAEFLPVESADMHYATWTILNGEFIVSQNQGDTIESLQEDYGNQIIPCWSLAALLEEIPDITVNDVGENLELHIKKNYLFYENESTGNMFEIETELYEDMIDACYEMILKLKGNNMI